MLLVDFQEIGGTITDRKSLDMFILSGKGGIDNGKITAKRNREIVRIGHIAQILSLTGGTTPLAGIQIIQVAPATHIPDTLIVPGSFRKGSSRESDVRYSQPVGLLEQGSEETFGRIVTMAIIKQKLLSVKIIERYATVFGNRCIVFGNLILQSQVRNDAIITIIDGHL